MTRMEDTPSAPLLRMLREAADTQGLNTAALARAADIDRSSLKQVLAGQTPLTVDTFVRLAEALSLGANELAALATTGADALPAPTKLTPVAHQESLELPPADPLGDHASQTLRLGFSLGCDMVFMLRTSELKDSGIPDSALDQFEAHMPIRLDAAFHQHNDPRFLPDGLTIQLSFDAIYECSIPWSAFVQITMIPLASTPTATEPSPPAGPHLRLVE
jgi:transcriptional regulator with XRE-family HTH domain